MTTSHRRIALLTGASLAALGTATPAFAAPHDLAADGTYAGTSVVDTTAPYTDTITICAIATASPECFIGVKNSGAAAETSNVSTPATGQIFVKAGPAAAGPVALSVVNAAGNSAEVGAVAIATGPAATANAFNRSAISETAGGTGAIALNVTNNGTLLLDSFASANATTGNATALASITSAIYQDATATGADVNNNVTNNGVTTIAAVANANAPAGSAFATADNTSGIYQYASTTGTANAANVVVNPA